MVSSDTEYSHGKMYAIKFLRAEIYPSESRLVDTSNQYHLWVYENVNIRIPFGYQERLVTDVAEAVKVGAKQRKL